MNSKIIVFATMAVGILVALFLGMAVGEGRKLHIAAVFAVMVGAPLLLSLGHRFWYLIPLSLASGLPAIPFSGRSIMLAEVCIPICFAIFITRTAFKLDKIVVWRSTYIPIYLFMAWVFFIFILNPVGIAAFGSATMGGRFYFKLGLAFMAFLIMASRRYTEQDCKWIAFSLMGGAILKAGYEIVKFVLFGAGDEILNPNADDGGSYTWHQVLSLPAVAFAFLLFAWKKPSDIFTLRNPLLSFLYITAILLALFSGKRMGIAAVLLAPVVSAFIYRQYAYILTGGLAALLFAGIVILGHGKAFTFPVQMQRALSLLPADWDYKLQHMEGGRDPFRESLRRFAIENIKRDPIIGQGFSVEYSTVIAQIMATRYLGGEDSQAAPYAIGRSWHNRWLGYAADFGIPLSIIQAILYLTVVVVAFKSQAALTNNTYLKTTILFILIYTARDLMASHTSGHTANDAYNCWWMYGFLFAVYAAQTAPKKTPSIHVDKKDFLLGKISRA
jgi:hypothetical protein